jgi:ammonium transporter, Amt family
VIVEWWHRGKPTMLDFVAGLVAVTPAAGYVSPAASLLIGAAAGVGGILGALLTGVFAQKSLNPGGADGLLAGNAAQPGKQLIGVGVVGAYSAIVTDALLKLVDRTMGLRAAKDDELEGLDSSQHGESGYVM